MKGLGALRRRCRGLRRPESGAHVTPEQRTEARLAATFRAEGPQRSSPLRALALFLLASIFALSALRRLALALISLAARGNRWGVCGLVHEEEVRMAAERVEHLATRRQR